MYESERLQRIRENIHNERDDVWELDEKFAARIAALLNHPSIESHCLVDAYYYDYSAIPDHILNEYNPRGDIYHIFGITSQGLIISDFVYRWDLDSDDRIVDGKVIHPERLNLKTNND